MRAQYFAFLSTRREIELSLEQTKTEIGRMGNELMVPRRRKSNIVWNTAATGNIFWFPCQARCRYLVPRNDLVLRCTITLMMLLFRSSEFSRRVSRSSRVWQTRRCPKNVQFSSLHFQIPVDCVDIFLNNWPGRAKAVNQNLSRVARTIEKLALSSRFSGLWREIVDLIPSIHSPSRKLLETFFFPS